MLFLERGTQGLWQVVHGAESAKLKSTQVGDNGPTIFGGNLGSISAHKIAPVSDHVKQFAVGHFYDALIVQVSYYGHRSDLLGDAVAISRGAMAGGASNGITFPAALQQLAVDGSTAWPLRGVK